MERAVRLSGPDGGSFRFDPGAQCLRFGLSGGPGDRAAYEKLHSPADLPRWVRAAIGVAVGPVTGAELAAARRLRDAVWRCADARIAGRPLPPADVAVINRSAAGPPPAPMIDAAGHRAWASPVTASQALSAIARDAVDLFTGPRGRRLRACAGHRCSLVFVDASRSGRRRWCSMQRCGNRAKVHAHRDRHGGAAAAGGAT